MAAPRPKGNTRTGQDQEFTAVDNVLETRETYDRNEKRDVAQNAETVAADKAGMDVTDREQRTGRTMTTDVLTAKLRAINPNFVVRVSKSDSTKCGIYLPQWEQVPTGGWVQNLVHIMGCENTNHPELGQPMPEFSIIETLEEVIPTIHGDRKRKTMDIEVRGWRTVIARLLIKGLITASDVQREFGLTPSKESARWHELMSTPQEIMAELSAPKEIQ